MRSRLILPFLLVLTTTVAVLAASAQARSTVPAPRADTLPLFYEYQVIEPVRTVAWAPPKYPDSLKKANVEGEVLIEFVVDTAGRMEPGSMRIVRTSHPAFSNAVVATVGSARFAPGLMERRPVRQVVNQRFIFSRKRS